MNLTLAKPTASVEALHVSLASGVTQAVASADWNALAGKVPFRGWEWLDAWSRHYAAPNVSPMVLVVRDAQQQLVGLAPWCVTTSPLDGRVIRLMGSGEVCSDYVTLIAAPEHALAVAENIAEWLSEEADRWDLLRFEGIALGDAAMAHLSAALIARGHEIETRRMCSSWSLTLPDRWDEYLPRLSSSRRDRVRQLSRRWLDSGLCVSRVAETQADVERAWPILCDLHQRRRQSLGEHGCFASERFAAFHDEMMQWMFEAGRLRLHWIEYEGRPIASEYGIIGGDTIYAYQSGFEPDVGKMKPGWLNTIASVRLAIEQGFRHYDLLRGDEPYKKSWRCEPQTLVEMRIVGKQVSARLRHRLLTAGSTARHWVAVVKDRIKLRNAYRPPSMTPLID